VTEEEAGARGYEWYLSANGTKLQIFERYADSAAAMAHMQGVGELLPKLLSNVEPGTAFVGVCGAPDAKLMEASSLFAGMEFPKVAGFRKAWFGKLHEPREGLRSVLPIVGTSSPRVFTSLRMAADLGRQCRPRMPFSLRPACSPRPVAKYQPRARSVVRASARAWGRFL